MNDKLKFYFVLFLFFIFEGFFVCFCLSLFFFFVTLFLNSLWFIKLVSEDLYF